MWSNFAIISTVLVSAITLVYGYLQYRLEARYSAFKKLNPDIYLYKSFFYGNAGFHFVIVYVAKFLGFKTYVFCDVKEKMNLFPEGYNDVVALVTPFSTNIFTANAEIVKEIGQARVNTFTRPNEIFKIVGILGPNLLSVPTDEWRRHRRIATPHFSEANYELVHNASIKVVGTMFKEWERKIATSEFPGKIEIPHISEEMRKVALCVICAANFGEILDWEGTGFLPEGRKMTMKQSISIVADNIRYYLALPKFIFKLPIPILRHLGLAFDEYVSYMTDIIEQTRVGSHDSREKRSLMASLVEANEKEDDSRFTQSELMGNIFAFLFAGFETTGFSLSYALALMALKPETQDLLYEDIVKVTNGKTPTYDQSSKLDYAYAILFETLRLYPIGTNAVKQAGGGLQDTDLFQTVLGKYQLPVNINMEDPNLKNTYLFVSFLGLHYNPKYWSDPTEFRPERFLNDDYNKNAFIPWSVGHQACIGKKFSQVEFICVLSILSLNYTWEISPSMGNGSQKAADKKANRLMKDSFPILVLQTREPMSIMFKPRK